MKVVVEVSSAPSDGSFILRRRIFDADTQIGEFFLSAGMSLTEAESLARSIVRLAETGFDLRKLMPDR